MKLHASLIVGDNVHAFVTAQGRSVIGVEASAAGVAIGEDAVGGSVSAR